MGNEYGLPYVIRVRDDRLQALERATENERWVLEQTVRFQDSTGWFGKLMHSYYLDRARRERQKKMEATAAASVAQAMVAIVLTSEVRSVRAWAEAHAHCDMPGEDELCYACGLKHESPDIAEESHKRKE